MKKTITTILIIAMVLSLGLNIFLFKPKQAKAFLGIGDITIDIVNQVKDWILDQLPKTVARHMMIRLQQEIARWAQGGFSDENKPFAMTSWKQEIQEALNIASGRFVQEFGLTPLCAPIRVSLNTMLGLGLSPYGRVPYTEYAACTIGNIVDNVEEFYKNPSIGLYGWDTWTALSRPQNNIYGSFLLAAQRQAELESEEIAEKEKEIEVGQGYKSEAICTEDDEAACKARCQEVGPPSPACLESCEKSSIGVCLKKQTTKLGSEIKTSLDKAIGSDIDWLITADEITEMLNLVFSGLFTKLIHGTGLSVKPFYQAQTTVSKYQFKYGYQQQYKKTQTPEDLKKLRTDILNNILQAIKRISTSSYECDKDYQLKGEVFQEVAAEILDQESQHLYTGTEGVDLKPDFEVLDPWNAPFKTYGTTWDDIPFNRYPEKCSKIVNKKCSDIAINLPYELNLNNINSECTTGCLGRINDYREEKNEEGERKFTDDKAVSKAVEDGECSNFAIGNACLQGGYLIDKTENRCNECVTKAQKECESIKNSEEKKYCIEKNCGGYKDISPSIVDAQDFYNRCQAYNLKNNCNVCLKEYFMPANYCGEIYDYVNQGFVKYPAQAYEDLWWGGFNKFDDCANNTTSTEKIQVALTCRVLPDFQFPGGGTCKSLCSVTDEELKDITDHQPEDDECNPREWRAGAYSPGGQYISYLVRKKATCCPALTGHEPEMYKKCRGIIGDVPEEERTVCKEGETGWFILSNLALQGPVKSGTGTPAFADVIHRPQAYADHVILRNWSAGGTAKVYITEPYCDAIRVWNDPGGDYATDINNDGEYDHEWIDDFEKPGDFLGYCMDSDGNFKSPSSDKIICKLNSATENFKDCENKLANYDAWDLWIAVEGNPGTGGAEICVVD